MNLSFLLSCFLGHLLFFSINVYGWDTDDHEIFDLVSALEASEGKGTTFYTFLNITKSATLSEINKAARRRSLELHPDKNPNVKNIEARFARLGVITAILRDEEKRERYNFFHDNGVPKWKGTGYMYSRWQPGLGFAIMFVLSVATLMHYGIQHVHYRSELTRIRKFQIAAKQAAYGPKGLQPDKLKASSSSQALEKDESEVKIPRKKVKISIEKSLSVGEEMDKEEDSDIPVPMSRQERRRQLQAGGKSSGANNARAGQAGWIDMVVEGDFVWIVAEDGTELPLDESAATKPSFKNTFLPATAQRFISSYLPQSSTAPNVESSDQSKENSSQLENKDEENVNGVVRKRKTGKSKK